jgi:hypothetical protein
MGIITILGRKITTADDSYSEKYWPQVTELIRLNYGSDRITEAKKVQEILRRCFNFLCDCFTETLKQNKKASFFLFVNDIHEDSIDIYRHQLTGNRLAIDQGHFILSRRIMKCILEQGCTLEMEGHPNLYQEVTQNSDAYSRHLDELIYLGSMAITMSEFISRSKLCPHSIGVEISNNEFTRLTFEPFNTLFTWWRKDYDRHSDEVQIGNNIVLELKAILQNKLAVSYDRLCDFIFMQSQFPIYRFGLLRFDDLIGYMHTSYGYSTDFLNTFYSGLMVSKRNVLSFDDCIMKNQNEYRHMYRPILEYTIDGKPYCIIGANKWSESLGQLMTNCLPFSQFPSEWNAIKPLKLFFQSVMDSHDKILEDPAVDIMKEHNVIFDRTIKSIKRPDNRNISIVRLQNVGEIDIMFIDPYSKVIFVCECKHNRSRYDLYLWINEITKYRADYEPQLLNKCAWISQNKILALEHLELINSVNITDKDEYTVVPLFIINAPSLYMYDSEYLVLTLHDLRLFFTGEHKTVEFNGEINGKPIIIQKPYFQNAERLFVANNV